MYFILLLMDLISNLLKRMTYDGVSDDGLLSVGRQLNDGFGRQFVERQTTVE